MTDLSLVPTTAALRRTAGYLTSVWMLIALIPLGILTLDPAQFPPIMEIAIRAFLGTPPYIAVAVLLIACLKASGAESVIARAFVGRPSRMIVLAALFGGLAPFCSCEVTPFIAGLLALGVPLPAVMAFWLASPLIDPPPFSSPLARLAGNMQSARLSRRLDLPDGRLRAQGLRGQRRLCRSVASAHRWWLQQLRRLTLRRSSGLALLA